MNDFSHILTFHSNNTPDKIFINDITYGVKFTYSEFNQVVDKTASYLISRNISQGEIVSIIIGNSWVYMCLYFAILRIGAIVNPFPTLLDTQDIVRYLSYVNPKLIVAGSEKYEELLAQDLQYNIDFSNETEWLSKVSDMPKIDNYIENDSNQEACLYYSSGTTSDPKGIVITHENMVENIRSVVNEFRFSSEENHLLFLPLGHTASINYSMLPCLMAGGTITIADSIWGIRNNFWNIVSAYNITYLQMVPTSLYIILNMPFELSRDDISSLRWIGCGSSTLLKNKQLEFQSKFGIPVGNLYGLSESGPSHIDYPLSSGWKPGSIGFPLSVNDCMVVDSNNVETPVGSCGEIVLKGKNIFKSYYKNKCAYESVVVDGFFHTGDIGYKDNNGRFFILDRKKDLIIKGGVNIAPIEIEEILTKHPKIIEAAVVGVQHDLIGEVIYAFLKVESKISSSLILSFCSKYLSSYKLPDSIIFVDDLPKGASGKVLKRTLRERVEE